MMTKGENMHQTMIQLTVGSADHVRATIVDLHAQYGIPGGYIVLHNFIVRFG